MPDAAAKYSLRGTGLAEAVQQGTSELVDIVGPAVGERVLSGVPRGFDRMELRSVSVESLEVQPRILAAEVSQTLRVMDRGAVPNNDDVCAQVRQQLPQEIVD